MPKALATLVAVFWLGILSYPSSSGADKAVTRPAPGLQLCDAVNQVERLSVTRTDAFPQNGFTFSFPARVTVRSADAARGVAQALCALRPVPPTRTYSCPADFGIVYHLDFTLKSRRPVRPVTVDATGCGFAKGARGSQMALATPSFWEILGRAMGLAHPTNATFRGSRPPD